VTESVLASLASIEVQSNKYSNIVCVLSIYETGPSALGIGFFRRHHVTFDFPNQMLYLRPAKQFDIQEEYDMSGLHLLRVEGKTVVYSLDADSQRQRPAFRRAIPFFPSTEKPCTALAMQTIRKAFRTKSGKKYHSAFSAARRRWK